MSWVRYLAAAAVLGHAIVYLTVGGQLPTPIAGWNGRSWLLRDAVGTAQTVRIAVVLHVGAGVVLAAAAFAIALTPLSAGYWRLLAVGGGVLGAVAFLVFWDGQVRLLLEEGLVGAAFSAALVLVALTWAR